jgi:tRNA-specific 2-thiouridylase
MVRLCDVNWLTDPPAGELHCTVKLRARDAMRPATVRLLADGAAVALDEPALPAPGQACVFYDGDRVLGGGFIRREEAMGPSDGAGHPIDRADRLGPDTR